VPNCKTVDLAKIDVLAHVRPLPPALTSKLKKGAITVGLCSPASEADGVKALAKNGTTSFALELVPRISRAQSMDALTSQALVAGYRCVLEGAMRLPRFFPLYMTAAGTVPPANVLVLGAGVAGLQAIATAKRLGAKVQAYDVRSASADEVRSMGGTFIELDLGRASRRPRRIRQRTQRRPGETSAGTSHPLRHGGRRHHHHGRYSRTPRPEAHYIGMMNDMKNGSVIIDLAAETGGNVEGSVAGKDTAISVQDRRGDITLVGMKDVPSTMAFDASRLYAKNIQNLIQLMTVDGAIQPDFDDEVVARGVSHPRRGDSPRTHP
jgi:H+-translocating NAD(P) transhydrogenase subunit alpha